MRRRLLEMLRLPLGLGFFLELSGGILKMRD
jgi:hypothetical protein